MRKARPEPGKVREKTRVQQTSVSNLRDQEKVRSPIIISIAGSMYWRQETEPSEELKFEEMASEMGPVTWPRELREHTGRPGRRRGLHSKAVYFPAG